MQRLLITEPQADHLADALELAIETAHETTLEHDENSAEYIEAVDSVKALSALLEQIDPENPILRAEARPGRSFDWDKFWSDIDAEDDDEEEEDDEPSLAERLSVAQHSENDLP